jgi:predicted amidohydrolase
VSGCRVDNPNYVVLSFEIGLRVPVVHLDYQRHPHRGHHRCGRPSWGASILQAEPLRRERLLRDLKKVRSFGDLLAWAYLPVARHYDRIVDAVGIGGDEYWNLRSTIAKAVEKDAKWGPSIPRDTVPELTIEKLKKRLTLTSKARCELVVHAVLCEVDSKVAAKWREDDLTDGRRIPFNDLFRRSVCIFERRTNVLASILPGKLNPSVGRPGPLSATQPGPFGSEDEARALAPNTVFVRPVENYRTVFIAKGWKTGDEPPYKGLKVIADCVVGDLAHIDWTGGVVNEVGVQTAVGGVRDQSRMQARIERTLRELKVMPEGNRVATILVYPELTIDQRLLSSVRERAKHATVAVLGSRHVGSPNGRRNQAVAMYRGNSWRYNKATRYIQRGGILEPISIAPRRLVFVDTPIGRLTVVICKDFLSPEIRAAIDQAGTDFVLVPSMTPAGLEDIFRKFADALATGASAVTLVANTCVLMRGLGLRRKLKRVGFLMLPLSARRRCWYYGCTPVCGNPSFVKEIGRVRGRP